MTQSNLDFNHTKMYRFTRFIIIYLSTFFFTSCTSLLFTSIDVLRPAAMTFPKEVNHIAIVNYTNSQPHSRGHTNDLFDKSNPNVSIDTDSLPIFALASFVETIQDTEFFTYVDFDLNSLNKSEDFNSFSLLPQHQIDELYNQYDVDALIVLNRLAVNDQLGELYDTEFGTFIAFLEARYEYNWSIHLQTQKNAYSLVTKDTVYWEAESYFRKRSLQDMPDRRDALIDGAIITAQRSVNQFIPYWEKEDRYFFKLPGKQFQAGLDALYKKDWDEAIKLWEERLEKVTNSNVKAKLTHNIAVLYEIKADIKKAVEYSDQSVNFLANLLLIDINKYMIILEQNDLLNKRLMHLDKLNQQLGITE